MPLTAYRDLFDSLRRTGDRLDALRWRYLNASESSAEFDEMMSLTATQARDRETLLAAVKGDGLGVG